MSARWLVVAAAFAPVALVSFVLPWGLELLVFANLLWVAVWALDWRRAPRREEVSVVREAPPAFSVGRPAQVTYRWGTSRTRPIRLLAREVRPGTLGGLAPPRPLDVLQQGTSDEIEVIPARRGRADGGGLVVRAFGPWGLAWRQWRIDLPWSAVVFPARVSSRLTESTVWAARRREAGRRAVRHRGAGRLFESLREWVPGDDIRHIDWKATARRRKVIARQYEDERRQQLLLVLDTGRLMTAETGGSSRLEHAVQAALELAYVAIEHDDNVGIMVFADGVKQYVPPQRGRRGLRAVLEALAVAEAALVEPDYPGAFRYLAMRNRRRALSVVLTDVIDRFASDALVANLGSLRPRHVPLALTLRDPALDQVAHARPESPGVAYRKAAAEALLAAREEGLAAMRRSGTLVVDAPAPNAAQAVVKAYRELKRRGRL